MEFAEAVNIITRHLEGATGDVSPRKLDQALIRVLPSLKDIAEETKFWNRSDGQRARQAAE